MFFFIGGIQPKAVPLDNTPLLCPSCGLARAHLMRMDHYFSAFFIPLFRVKKGEQFLRCPGCGDIPRRGEGFSPASTVSIRDTCPACGAALEKSFRFCPYCGKRR